MLPILAPELKIPVASARSRLGNHSATVLMQAGKLAASPRPSRNMAMAKVSDGKRCARQHGRDTPDADSDGKSLARAKLVSQPARDDHPNGVSRLKRRKDVSVFNAVESRDDALEEFLQIRDDAAIDISDDGGQKQQRANDPALMGIRDRATERWQRNCAIRYLPEAYCVS